MPWAWIAAAADSPVPAAEAAQSSSTVVAPAAVMPTKVLNPKHHVYPSASGGLHCVWVRLQYSDGSKMSGVESSLPPRDTPAGLAVLRAYVKTKTGQRVAILAKYMPF